MEDTIFTKIIKGEIPSYKIYEDDKTVVFLDIHPKHEGHCLVVPKAQVEFIWDLSEEDYNAVMATAHKVGKHLREVLKTKYVGMQVVGVDVPHAHVHLIPFNVVEEFRNRPDMEHPAEDSVLEPLAKLLRMES